MQEFYLFESHQRQGHCFVKGILQGALENGDHTRGTSYMFFPGCATGFHAPCCRRNIYNILQSVWNSAAWYFWNAAHVIQLMSSRVGKVVDSFLQTSVGRPQNDDIELLKKRHLMDCLFFPAHTAGISSTTAKQHKSWLAWIRCRLYIRFAVNYSLTHHQKQKNWVAIGPLEKPHPLVLNKAERQWSLTALQVGLEKS